MFAVLARQLQEDILVTAYLYLRKYSLYAVSLIDLRVWRPCPVNVSAPTLR